MVRLFKFIFSKKGLAFFIALFSALFLGVGYYVMDVSASVPCEYLWIEGNTPSKFVGAGETYGDRDHSNWYIDDYETVTIKSTEEITLSGWWMEQNPGGKTVLMLHGLTSSKASDGILIPSGMLYKAGFNILAIDLRDHGDSTCEDGYYSAGQYESDDSAAALQWLVSEKGVKGENIGIYGNSLGALTTLNTYAKSTNFAAVAVHDPPVEFGTLVKEEMIYQGFPTFLYYPLKYYSRISQGVFPDKVTPEKALPMGNKQPILVFNGMLDDRVQPHHTDDLIALAKQNGIEIETKRWADMGHVEGIWGHTEEFEQILVAFFSKNLG